MNIINVAFIVGKPEIIVRFIYQIYCHADFRDLQIIARELETGGGGMLDDTMEEQRRGHEMKINILIGAWLKTLGSKSSRNY